MAGARECMRQTLANLLNGSQIRTMLVPFYKTNFHKLPQLGAVAT